MFAPALAAEKSWQPLDHKLSETLGTFADGFLLLCDFILEDDHKEAVPTEFLNVTNYLWKLVHLWCCWEIYKQGPIPAWEMEPEWL